MSHDEVLIMVPLYNGEATIANVLTRLKAQNFNQIVVCDDFSVDKGVEIVKYNFPEVHLIAHTENKGYGSNQKSLYSYAVEQLNFKYAIMVHGDGQYTPELCSPIAAMLGTGIYDVIIASRIITSGAVKNGMPLYKYLANRALTLLQNLVTGAKLSEYHTGFRGYTKNALRLIDFHSFRNDFVFDNQFLLSAIKKKIRIGEISCPTIYNKESSSISFKNSVVYGWGCLAQTIRFAFKRY